MKLFKILLLAIIAYSIGYTLGFVVAKAADIQIAIVDTGFDADELKKANVKLCDKGHYDAYSFKHELPREWHSTAHGTKMAIIAHRASKQTACIIGIKGLTSYDDNGGVNTTAKAVRHILTLKDVKVVSLSYTGDTFSYAEYSALKAISLQQKKIYVAAGNDRTNLDNNNEYDGANLKTTICSLFPVCYLGIDTMTPVGAVNDEGKRLYSSNWGSIVKDWALGAYTDLLINDDNYTSPGIFGSSPATATATGECAYKLSKGKRCD